MDPLELLTEVVVVKLTYEDETWVATIPPMLHEILPEYFPEAGLVTFAKLTSKVRLFFEAVMESLSVGRSFSYPDFLPKDLVCIRVSKTMQERLLGYEVTILPTREGLNRPARLEELGRIVANISHDFNNLLTVFGGHLGILRLQYPDNSHLEQLFRVYQSAVALVQGLVNYSANGAYTPQSFAIKDVVQEVYSMVKTLSPRHKISVSPSLDGHMVFACREQIGSCLMNLAMNALDAMPNGGQLDFYWQGTSGMAAVSVRDTGIGMSAEQLEAINEPYFTTKPNGHGLGLTSIKDIMGQHQGTLEVQSILGKGSVFTLRWPQKDVHDLQHVVVLSQQPEVSDTLVSLLQYMGYTHIYLNPLDMPHSIDLLLVDSIDHFPPIEKGVRPRIVITVSSKVPKFPAEWENLQVLSLSKPFTLDNFHALLSNS